jgi:hypothetical protein
MIVSNRLDVDVRTISRDWERAARTVLTQHARLLYHRLPAAQHGQLTSVSEFVSTNPAIGSLGSVHYAIGSVLKLSESKKLRTLARNHFERASQDRWIGEHQREQALKQLSNK